MSTPSTPEAPAPLPRNDLNRNPYGFGEQAARAAWEAVQATLFRWSPQPLRGWRRALLRLFGAKVGKGAAIHRTARVEFPWRFAIGDFSSVGREAWIYSVGVIDVGVHATISARCVLCAGAHDLDDPATPLRRAAIQVGDHAWLGMDVFVGPDVALGRGCVIGARSAVFKDMPEGMVCHGHPCEPKRPRDGARDAQNA